REQLRDLTEGPELQQPGEQHVSCLQQRQVLLVLDLPRGHQTGRLEVEERGGHHQELGHLLEPGLPAQQPRVRDELVGHRVQGHLGHVEATRVDERQQQVERAGEVGQVDGERPRGRLLGLRGPRLGHGLRPRPRWMTSRASARAACAPGELGAHVVMGSPATVVSGNRTVRVTSVSKTFSPNTSTTRPSTSRAWTVRRSNIVMRMPVRCRRGLMRSRTLSIVSVSRARPRSAKYSHSMGMRTPSAQASALTVSRPSDGWQSIRTKSYRSSTGYRARPSACSRPTSLTSWISAADRSMFAGMRSTPSTRVLASTSSVETVWSTSRL